MILPVLFCIGVLLQGLWLGCRTLRRKIGHLLFFAGVNLLLAVSAYDADWVVFVSQLALACVFWLRRDA